MWKSQVYYIVYKKVIKRSMWIWTWYLWWCYNIGPKYTVFSQSDQHPSTERCKLYQLYLLTKVLHSAILFCFVLWLAKWILLLAGDVESNPGLTLVCAVQCMWRSVLHWTVHPDDGPGPMDKPCQMTVPESVSIAQ